VFNTTKIAARSAETVLVLALLTSAVAASAQADTPRTSAALEEVVVTAQKRSENLQDVPISVSAFTEDMLEQSGINRLEDLPSVVPGLTFGRSAAGSVTFIRGIGATNTAAGQEAPVATYVDGVYVQSLWSNNLALKDVERIEVLKGPQGTLFGRNATGGLIHVITRTPSDEAAGEASVSIGSKETYEGSVYGTTGIAPNLAANFTGYVRRQNDGYGKNLVTGNDANFREESTARTKWHYSGDRTTITLSGDYSNIKDPRGLNREVRSDAVGVGGTLFNGDFYDVQHNVDTKVETDSYGTSLQIEHDFGGAELVSISAYRDDDTDFFFDNDVGPQPRAIADIYYFTELFTQELRLSSVTDADHSWMIGAFYLHTNAGNELNVLAGPTQTPVAAFDAKVKTNSYSAFAEYSMRVGPRGRVTAGLRYTVDKRDVSGHINAGATRLSDQDETWKEPTWRLVYDHHLNDDVMLYASYNRGFKSGNYNIIPATTPPYDPEIVDAYEIGAKTDLWDGRIRLNVAAFYYDYQDMQVNVIRSLATETLNAASAEIKGLEADVTARVTEYLTLSASAAYIDGKYDSFRDAQHYFPPVPGERCPGVTTGPIPVGGNSRWLMGFPRVGCDDRSHSRWRQLQRCNRRFRQAADSLAEKHGEHGRDVHDAHDLRCAHGDCARVLHRHLPMGSVGPRA
jgi:iron complex outermembrane receptor protein